MASVSFYQRIWRYINFYFICILMALSMEVGLGPGHIVLDWDPNTLTKSKAAPDFRPIFIVAKRHDASRCHLVWR